MKKEMGRLIRNTQKQIFAYITGGKRIVIGPGCGGMNYISVVTGSMVYFINNTACTAGLYGELNQFKDQLKGEELYIISVIKKIPDDERSIQFIDWLVNRSPYSIAFISKNTKRIISDMSLVCRTDVPSNILVGGLIAARRLYEYDVISEYWYKLVERGCNENLAYLMSHYCKTSGNSICLDYCEYGHTSVCTSSMDKTCISNFIKNKPYSIKFNYNESLTYNEIDGTWGELTNSNFWTNLFIKHINKKKDVKNNIFIMAVKKTRDNLTCEIEYGLNQLKLVNDEIMEIVNG